MKSDHIHSISFQNNKVILKVGNTPLLIRVILFLTAFLFFLLPVGGLILNVSAGNRIAFSGIIMAVIFSLCGFYLLRISLWNSYGKEIIEISGNKVSYIADYGLFKDNVKELSTENLRFSIIPKDNSEVGVMLFKSDQSQIESVIQLPISELEFLSIDIATAILEKANKNNLD
ncbi:hypothetical protein ASE92_01720 [Pedobacter sp. Leaf41]|uniref:hypothetical protein n=1 Tax=Pedobacter sp. Leaf41 TaxID=1736218 RepID=UPI00070273DD|nr:hypothetical protein [Pedobacter sp. Leaf41]KQN38179.1 hypothetical protein ASE92_01720 [Pedobacter sp. Leaf41]